MEINRRRCLSVLGAGLLMPLTGTAGVELRLASAATDKQGKHWLQLFNQQGTSILKHALPGRAHHVVTHPYKPWIMAVARRPDRFIEIVDYHSAQQIKRIEAAANRHFFGHAVFSSDGRWLACSENNIPSGEGRLVIRDCNNNFNIVADMASFGIGPHELLWAQDQKTLIVANGGIKTHPNRGREKLNLDSMRPNLSYVDSHNGTLLEQVQLPEALHQLSIRHIDVNAQNTVAIAMQYQGGLADQVDLTALHRRGQSIQLLKQPEPIRRKMKQYCGSVRFDHSGHYLAVSAPRGNLISIWNQDGHYLNSIRVADGCGITASQHSGEFILSSGRGRLYKINAQTGQKIRYPLGPLEQQAWDNHLTLA